MSEKELRAAYAGLQKAYERQVKESEQRLAENTELRRQLEETEQRLAEAPDPDR